MPRVGSSSSRTRGRRNSQRPTAREEEPSTAPPGPEEKGLNASGRMDPVFRNGDLPMLHSSTRVSFAALLLGLSLLAPASATTYVMMPDEALVDSSPLIVEGRVVAVSGAPVETPSTDYRIEILHLLKGRHPGGEIVVRQLGGVNSEGLASKIWGLTRLGIGDRALLFLVPRADGTYGVNQLILGAFREVEVAGQRVAVRDLEGATELRAGASGKLASTAGGDRPRDVEGFSRWIEHRVEKRFQPADYFRDGLILPKFNLFA